MRDEQLAKTMRIDLIPAIPGGESHGKRRLVRITSQNKRLPEIVPKRGAGAGSRYEQLLQSIYDAALITDTGGRIIDVNDRAVEFFRYEREQLLGVGIVDLLSGADDSLIDTVLENLENHRFTLIQAYCVRRDGSHFPSEIAVNRIDLGEEVHLGFFARDITLRRQAEEMLRTEHNAIRNSGNGIAVADLAARLEYVNPAVTRMWGCDSDDQLIGRDVKELLGETAKAGKMLDTVLQEQEDWSGEMQAVRRNGEEFHVQVSAACNRNSDGDPVGVVFSFVDISDRHRAEEAEREAERQRVMLESLGAVCHHMGQPATILLANLGLMQGKVKGTGEDVESLVDSCVAAADGLGKILHRLNAVNEYKTTRYLEGAEEGVSFSEESRILDINGDKPDTAEAIDQPSN